MNFKPTINFFTCQKGIISDVVFSLCKKYGGYFNDNIAIDGCILMIHNRRLIGGNKIFMIIYCFIHI